LDDTQTSNVESAQSERGGWFSRLPWWGKTLFVLIYPVSIPYGLWTMWKGRRYTPPVRWVLTVVGVFVMILFFSVATADNTPSTTTPQKVAAVPVKATAPAAPEVVAPTVVPVDEAAAPVETPAPEPPAEPSVSAGDTEYASEVIPISQDVSEALGEFGAIMEADPTGVFTDEDTRMKVVIQMAIIKAGYPRAKALDPPARFGSAHADLLASLKLYDQAMDKFASGIDDVDTEQITAASALMTKANQKMNSASSKVAALVE